MSRPIFILSCLGLLFSCSKNDSGTNTPPPPPSIIPVTGITVTPGSVIMLLPNPASVQLTANIVPANATDKSVTWSSSNTAVATVNTAGLVSGLTQGTVIITATSVSNPTVSATATIAVLRTYDVYVVGNGPTASYQQRAIYWKNGVATALTGGVSGGYQAYAVTVTGTDVHIAGTTINSNNWEVPTYWKNGVAMQLSNPLADTNNYANSIAVSGSDVYVGGYNWFYAVCPSCTIGYNAFYWKINGSTVTKVPLITGTSWTDAYGIAVSGTDVYVTGSDLNNFYSTAKYWKNDLTGAVSLSGGVSYAKGKAIAIQGSDIYVAGIESCVTANCKLIVKLWKNNSSNAVTLTTGVTDAYATGIAVSGGDVYVAGWEKNAAGKPVAMCWKVNGNIVTPLALTNGQFDAVANGIAVSGSDVFIAGSEKDANGKRVAKYWRVYGSTVMPVVLPDLFISGFDSNAFGIFIK